jgi:serine/threonine protein kinase
MSSRAPGKTPEGGRSSDTGPVPAPIAGAAPAVVPIPTIHGYEILGVLGRGSMATVYKARQVSLARVVALKVLHPALALNPSYTRRFEREAQAAARLSHPNIVGALDVGEDRGLRYLAMEFVDGRTVAQVLSGGPIAERKAAIVAMHIARALDHAHRSGLVHRDIKPANIMVTKEGIAKLGDMGLAKEVQADGSQTDEGIAMGTPFYVSPEQARGERKVDIRTDIYGLGATMFHMVTGRVPYPGANPAVVMTKHLNDPVPEPDEINPAVSRGISQIIEKMLAKEREERYQSPAELMTDLQAYLDGKLAVRPAIQLKPRRRRRFR